LQACVELHRGYGLDLTSIVYPRNRVAFLDILPEFGITVYRGCEERWYAALDPRLARLLHAGDRVVAPTPPTYPLGRLREGQLVNLPASMFYMHRDGLRRYIPIASRVRQARRGITRAAERGELFHLWFHPFNLASDARLFEGLEAIFAYAAGLRESGRLCTLTMADTAERVRRGG
ncbi:MAG: hypothetical protein JOZ41_18340, partial [Chloroflexi bacterium]|nr:hypothetical protein [Chloroflexota bacterium]